MFSVGYLTLYGGWGRLESVDINSIVGFMFRGLMAMNPPFVMSLKKPICLA